MLRRLMLACLACCLGAAGGVAAGDGSAAPAVEPLTPAAKEPALPAFAIQLQLDLPALGALSVITVTRLFRSGHADCPVAADGGLLCDPKSVNSIDRLTAGFYSEPWQSASDYGLYGILAGTAAVLLLDEGLARGLNDTAVVTESILAGAAMSSMLTLAAARPRPYLYSQKASPTTRSGPDATESFLSGHTAVCFAAGTALFIAERRLHPDSAGPWIVLGASAAAATFVSVARVMGGNHFLSDDLFGAIAGVSMGVLFPALHDAPVRLTPLVGDGQRGLSLQRTF